MKTATLALVSLGMAGLLLCSCDNKDAAAAASAAQQEDAISVFRILPKTVTDTEEWFSVLEGESHTLIHPQITGTILEYCYQKGALVKKGDVLFRIDPVMFQANVERAKANLQVAEANVVTAQADELRKQKDFARNEKLAPTGAISARDLEESRHALQAATAAVKNAQALVEYNRAQLRQAEIDLERTVVRAPIDGLVSAPNVTAGNTVTPQDQLATIYLATPMKVEFSFSSERLLRLFHRYDTAEAEFSEVPKFDIVMEDGSVFPEKGEIHALDNKISEDGLIRIEGYVDNSSLKLRPGMTVRVRVPIEEREALLVPQEAIITQMLNKFVLVVDKAGVPHLVPVQPEGEYAVNVQEADGFASAQKLVAIAGVGRPLAESLKEIGYDNPADAPVVADALNGVRATAVSAANSRNKEAAPTALKTRPHTFKPVFSEEIRLAAAALASLRDDDDTPQPAEKATHAEPTLPPFTVKVCPLTRRDVDITQEWYGTIRGKHEAELRPNISGILEDDHVKPGTLVKKGDVLFNIEDSDYINARDEAKASLDAALAAKDRAEAALAMRLDDEDRYHAMVKTSPGAVSEKTVTDAELQVVSAKAELKLAAADVVQARAALNIAEINLGYTTILAPFDGRVGYTIEKHGAMVTPTNQLPLAMVTSTDPMEVRFNVSGLSALRGLRHMLEAGAADGKADPITYEVVLEDGTPYPAKGVATGIDNELNKGTGTLQVIGELPNPDAALRSGMPVTVRAVQESIKDAWLVPARAPLCDGDRTFIFLMQKDNTPAKVPVALRNVVVIPAKDADGNEAVQPMQVIEPDNEMLASLLMVAHHMDNMGAVLLNAEKVADWKELALKYDQKLTPEQFDSEFAESGALNHRDFVLARMHAKDELELVAHAYGFTDTMELLLDSLGYEKGEPVTVVVEGAQQASMCAKANLTAGENVNTLNPVPFHYQPTRTVVGSVTALPLQDDTDTADAAAPAQNTEK